MIALRRSLTVKSAVENRKCLPPAPTQTSFVIARVEAYSTRRKPKKEHAFLFGYEFA